MYHNYYQETAYLQHYGRKGMKWYQNIYQTVTSASKRHRRKVAEKENRRRQRFNQRKKQKIISSVDLKKAYKNRKYFTTEELKKLNERSREIEALQNHNTNQSKSNKEVMKKPQSIQEKKQKTIQNVDLKTAYRNRKYFTTDELLDLQKRAAATSQIKKYINNQGAKSTARNIVKGLGKNGGDYVKTAQSVYNFYKTIQKNRREEEEREKKKK